MFIISAGVLVIQQGFDITYCIKTLRKIFILFPVNSYPIENCIAPRLLIPIFGDLFSQNCFILILEETCVKLFKVFIS